jgi:hypothetical protein
MWGLWILIFLFQAARGKSWTDLLVIVMLFSIFLGILIPFVPEWVIVILVISVHVTFLGVALLAGIKRKAKAK